VISARGVLERTLTVAYFQPVPAVDRLDIEDVFCGEAQDALYGGGHVLVHTVGELDHDHGALPRSANQTTGYRTRATTKLPQHNLHDVYSSNLP